MPPSKPEAVARRASSEYVPLRRGAPCDHRPDARVQRPEIVELQGIEEFHTKKWHCTIGDATGHRDFVKDTTAGAHQAGMAGK